MYKTVIRNDFNETSIDMTFMITTFCNYNCIYCIEKIPKLKNAKWMNLSKAVTFIKNYISIFPTYKINIGIYGGEPTQHPDILDFCEKICLLPEIDTVEIFTNFSANNDLYKKLLAIPKLYIFTSYHKNNIISKNEYITKIMEFANYFEKMTLNVMLENYEDEPFNESYDLYKTLLKKCQQHFDIKTNIELTPVFSTEDYASIYSAKKHNLLKIINNLNNEKVEFTLVDENGKQSKIQKVIGYNTLNFKNWRCTSGKNSIFIDVLGYMYPCGQLYTRRHEIYKKTPVNVFESKITENMFKLTVCPLDNCMLCAPIKTENIKSMNTLIEEPNKNYIIKY